MKKEKELVDYDQFGTGLEERKNRFREGGVNMRYDEEYYLKEKSQWIKNTYRKVSNICMNIDEGVTQTFLQTYTRYNTPSNRMFCKVDTYQDSVKVYLRLDYRKLVDMPKWVRDYSQVAKQQWTELWLAETNFQFNETILWDRIKGLIEQSFQRVSKAKTWRKFPLTKAEKVVPEFVNTTKAKISIEIGNDGYCEVKLRTHKSQLSGLLGKIIE